jgi:hypothetical protein
MDGINQHILSAEADAVSRALFWRMPENVAPDYVIMRASVGVDIEGALAVGYFTVYHQEVFGSCERE